MKTLNNILKFLCDLIPNNNTPERVSLESVRFKATESKTHEAVEAMPAQATVNFFQLDRSLETLLGDSRRTFARVSKENFDEKLSHRLHFLSFL
ncbi:MAG: hypothetical protein R2877_08080 [Bdellovibrionota bacterium]